MIIMMILIAKVSAHPQWPQSLGLFGPGYPSLGLYQARPAYNHNGSISGPPFHRIVPSSSWRSTFWHMHLRLISGKMPS